MKPIIRVENLGKQYRIGQREAPYATVRESLVQAAALPSIACGERFNREWERHADSRGTSGR